MNHRVELVRELKSLTTHRTIIYYWLPALDNSNYYRILGGLNRLVLKVIRMENIRKNGVNQGSLLFLLKSKKRSQLVNRHNTVPIQVSSFEQLFFLVIKSVKNIKSTFSRNAAI